MPFDLRRFALARWASFVLHLYTLGRLLFIDRVGQDPTRLPPILEPHERKTNESIDPRDEDATDAIISQTTPVNYPPTEEQLEERIQEFIDSIGDDAVCRLASQHNDQRPCGVVGRDRGSFNVCFFVRFTDDDTTWVVRIPLEPVVENMWDKVQSEVTTMRYIECNTTIPIPHVHAYGQGAELISGGRTTQVFLIYDYIPGRPLDSIRFANASKDQRDQFYDDLIDILVQLRKLEFPTAGSLLPNPDNKSQPIVGGLLSMAANELQRCCQGREGRLRAFTSEEQYVAYQYQILSETYRLPTEDLTCEQAQMELFALHSLETLIPKFIDPRPNSPFVLAHPDLRCGNIIVTEDLHIHGIIDWEFACTVPRHLSTPPPWITGHDIDAAVVIPHGTIHTEFLEVLEARGAKSRDCDNLVGDWKYLPDLAFPMAQIFRHPSSLIRIYYKFIFPRLFEGGRAGVVSEFFERQDTATALAVEVNHRIKESICYTQYLKDHGLFIIDQQSQEKKEWLAKVEQLRKRWSSENCTTSVPNPISAPAVNPALGPLTRRTSDTEAGLPPYL